MKTWEAVTSGAFVGLAVGGPVGAVVGGLLGQVILADDKSKSKDHERLPSAKEQGLPPPWFNPTNHLRS